MTKTEAYPSKQRGSTWTLWRLFFWRIWDINSAQSIFTATQAVLEELRRVRNFLERHFYTIKSIEENGKLKKKIDEKS